MKGLPSYPNPLLGGWRFDDGVPAPNLWYRSCRRGLQVLFSAAWKVQVFNRHYEPTAGSALYICNHQSFLDPPLMSLALRRPMNYMGRDSLFGIPVFKHMIRSLNAFPIRLGVADPRAMREAIRRLRAGGQLVLFPEGTRTYDGRILPFMPGAAVLARRGADWIVPTLIDGAYEAWPRSKLLPRPGRITIAYCRPLPREKAKGMSNEQFTASVRETIIALQHDIRRRRGRDALVYDADPPEASP